MSHRMTLTTDLVTFTEEILNGKLHFLFSENVDLVTFTEEIPNGKLHFLCSEKGLNWEPLICNVVRLIV